MDEMPQRLTEEKEKEKERYVLMRSRALYQSCYLRILCLYWSFNKQRFCKLVQVIKESTFTLRNLQLSTIRIGDQN